MSVIGGGVSGLTTALTLARRGHRVRVVRDLPVEETVSRVAGGLWFPYHADPRDLVHRWSLVSLARFRELADVPGTGVRLLPGLLVHRSTPDRWWTEGLPWREATPEELPPGATGGTVTTVPLVDTGAFLPWLERECAAAGVALERAHVEDVATVGGDAVVVAAGLGARELLGDEGLAPGRGQVVRVANPGLDRWVVDGEHPDGLTYVLPHPGAVVCGGTDVEGEWSTVPDPAVEEAVLRRCRALVPALAGAEVVGRAVGLRPLAPAVRLGRTTDDRGRPVVTNHGHGGAGVTLAWGCAEAVADLLAP